VLSATRENVAYRICQELDLDILLTGHQHMSVPGQMVSGTLRALPSAAIRSGVSGSIGVSRCPTPWSSQACVHGPASGRRGGPTADRNVVPELTTETNPTGRKTTSER